MSETQLIPPPQIVRERLAHHEREVRHLKRLYKLSIDVAEDARRRSQPVQSPRRPVAV